MKTMRSRADVWTCRCADVQMYGRAEMSNVLLRERVHVWACKCVGPASGILRRSAYDPKARSVALCWKWSCFLPDDECFQRILKYDDVEPYLVETWQHHYQFE
eukprot:4165577-Pleurochrysis_carterae.AAC.1